MENLIANTIVSVVSAVIAIASGYIVKLIKTNNKFSYADKILTDAIFYAEKQGIIKNLTGEAKKNLAVQWAESELKKIGFTQYDEETLYAKLEKLWALNVDTLNEAYSDQKAQAKQDEEKTLEEQKQSLADEKAQLDLEKAALENKNTELKLQQDKINNILKSVISDQSTTSPAAVDDTKPSQPVQPITDSVQPVVDNPQPKQN